MCESIYATATAAVAIELDGVKWSMNRQSENVSGILGKCSFDVLFGRCAYINRVHTGIVLCTRIATDTLWRYFVVVVVVFFLQSHCVRGYVPTMLLYRHCAPVIIMSM